MNDPMDEREAEALYAALKGEKSSSDPALPAAVPAQEAELGRSLQAFAQSLDPDPEFTSGLEATLHKAGTSQHRGMRRGVRRALTSIAWTGLVIAGVLGMVWAIRTVLPAQPGQAPLGVSRATSTPAELPALPILTGTLMPFPSYTPTPPAEPSPTSAPTASGETYRSPSFPGVELVLNAVFPTAPADGMVYEQLLDEPLTPELALQAAAKLGVNGIAYHMPSEAEPMTNSLVSDGERRVNFLGSPNRFYYDASMLVSGITEAELPPPDEQIRRAETWLLEHGVLTGDYTSELVPTRPGVVRFWPILDGRKASYSLMDGPWIEVTLGVDGIINHVEAATAAFRELGRFPLRSAEDAWQKLVSEGTNQGVAEYEMSALPGAVQGWQRIYPLDQPQEMYGYLTSYPAVATGEKPLLDFNNYIVEAYPSGMQPTSLLGKHLHIQGTLHADARGVPMLTINSWEATAEEQTPHSGTILRQDGQAYLQEGEQKLLLPDLPANISSGEPAETFGVIVAGDQPTLDWYWINVGSSTNGGGGGGGSGMFVDLNLAGDSPSGPHPTATPLPGTEPGSKAEGIQGRLSIVDIQRPDGTTYPVYGFILDPSPDFPNGSYVKLNGEATAGLVELDQMPLRIWGTFTATQDSSPLIALDRYEEVYPGTRLQAWLGRETKVALEGKQVILFTTAQGEKYVLANSIETDPDEIVGSESDTVIVYGARFNLLDERFGGYPVVHETGIRVPEPGIDLQTYQPTIAPPVMPEPPSSSSTIHRVTIDRIDLIESMIDLRFGPPGDKSTQLYAQPAWRFSGSYEDGTLVEVLVQALPDQYLR